MNDSTIASYDSGNFVPLVCDPLSAASADLEHPDAWPERQIEHVARCGFFRWLVPVELGGLGWSEADILRAYLGLSGTCLTTTFVLTQLAGAVRRLATAENSALRDAWLDPLARGAKLATVGISHLTTSRQHLGKPVLSAKPVAGGYSLSGFSPWVTGAVFADFVLAGASLEDGRQLLAWVPTDTPGVRCDPPQTLVALTASRTGMVHFDDVVVSDHWLLSEPAPQIMLSGSGATTGGLQTSTLALGLACAARDYLAAEASHRTELQTPARQLGGELNAAVASLMALASGEPTEPRPCTPAELRATANSLVLRATQAALVAAKGAGYVAGHPVGRWCREALFFLVWSCPQPVSSANLCEFARIE